MSIQTNFRASDMLGAAKPKAEKPVAKPARPVYTPPVVVEEPTPVVVEDVVETVVVEDAPEAE
jgi:hypothetical protein